MTDSSEIGRYGTLRLLKRHEPDTTVAFFPIDDETVTFGRSKQCSIRLYYDCVSELHCTLQISEERKAFLLVQGTNGLLVDGCQVNPSGSPSSALTTVPLTNGSEIEIYKKRFKFEYPPKEIRAALLATPRHTKGRRSLRMSMIRSAQVFTPRGSPDAMPQTPPRGHPRQDMDWNALRSPVKFPSQDGSPDQEMMLLDGERDDALVLEEEKDIIILEKVDDFLEMEVALPSESKHSRTRSVAFSIPSATPPPRHVPVPQTTGASHRASPAVRVNRRRSAPSLHRAVVLRSAQRALQREQERFEEQQEEEEVVAEVSPERELGPFEVKGDGDEDEDDDAAWSTIYQKQDQGEEIAEPNPPIVPSNASARPARRMSAFRASIDAMRKVIPLPFNWKAPEDVPLPDDDDDDYDKEDDDDREEQERQEQDEPNETLEDEREPVFETPVRRNMGPFMTPQFQFPRTAQRVPVDVKEAPASLGSQKTFGGAQRVRVVPAWKVADIVLPEPEKLSLVEQKLEVKKERISEEERQAIMARRKSALHTPSSLPAPGPRTFAFPLPARSDMYTPGEDSDEDAETMLEKMRQKMANVRRKSEARKTRTIVGGLQQSDEFSLLAPGSERKSRGFLDIGIAEETLSQMKRAEFDSPSAAKKPSEANDSAPSQDRDDMDILEASSDDDDDQPVTKGVPMAGASSLTPRFDGVREMFRQPRVEPKTPSFAGFKTMFKERSQGEAVAKTPSFRGVREMFNRAGGHTDLATPRLDLAEMFNEDETVVNSTEEDEVVDELYEPSTSRVKSTPTVKSEDDTVASTPALKTSTRTRKTTTSATKRSSRKKDVLPLDVPSAVVEEQASDHKQENDDPKEVESTPAPTVRRVAKRTARNTTTPAAEDKPPSEEMSGRGASRNTKKATPIVSEGATKGIIIHKTTKSRKLVDNDSEDEEPIKPVGKTSTGRSKRKNQQAVDTEAEQEDEREIPVKPKGRARKAKETETSDSEGIASTKPRRAQATKTTQGSSEPVESTSVPTATKPTRRVKVEDSDVEGSAPAAKAPKPKRGGRTKVTAEPIDVSPTRTEEHSSEAEDVTPAPAKGRSSKKGGNKKTPVSKDTTVDDKENAGDRQPKSSDKTPATRTRRAVVTPVEALDAPAKRTRSRK